MAVIVAFSDESERFTPDSEFFLGGYVAPETDWPWFASAWRERVLDGPPRLSATHMRELNDPAWREKRGITLRDVFHIVCEASRIVRSSGSLSALTGAVKRADIVEAFRQDRYKKKRHVPVGVDEPDYLAFVAYAYSTIREVHRKWPDAERVDFVVAKKPPITKHIEDFKNSIRRLLDPPLNDLVGELIPADPIDRLPLQAADMFLWHLQRYSGSEEPLPISAFGLFQDLNLDGRVIRLEKPHLLEMAERWASTGLLRSKESGRVVMVS